MTLSSVKANLSQHSGVCNFCKEFATFWLFPPTRGTVPGDAYVEMCDRCAHVLVAAIKFLPKKSDRWCLKPMDSEEVDVWVIENYFGVNATRVLCE